MSPGCEYGNYRGGLCTFGDCIYTKKHYCCRTCEPFQKDTCSENEENKMDWCDKIEPFECYVFRSGCCKKCKAFETDIYKSNRGKNILTF